eukprot:2619420-Amphidinium_carterae.1
MSVNHKPLSEPKCGRSAENEWNASAGLVNKNAKLAQQVHFVISPFMRDRCAFKVTRVSSHVIELLLAQPLEACQCNMQCQKVWTVSARAELGS